MAPTSSPLPREKNQLRSRNVPEDRNKSPSAPVILEVVRRAREINLASFKYQSTPSPRESSACEWIRATINTEKCMPSYRAVHG